MKLRQIFENTGRIVKGVNTTVDVGTDEIKKQAAKFGNTVDKDGYPPTLNKKIKGPKTNVLSNLGLSEGKFRSKDVEEFKPDNDALNDLKSKYLPDWEMLDHKTLQAKYVAKDHRHAEQFVSFINKLSEKMDHFAEVTQDVAEVTVKTSTFDVKGLTLLDFQLAMFVDDFAEKNDIEQVRMSGNFGMHEDIMLDEGVLDFLEPYVEKARGKIAKLRNAVKQEWWETGLMWEIIQKGTDAKDHEIEFANKQFKDMLKGVGLSAWYALPIPGNTLWITMVEKLLNKFNISIMPDEIKKQVFDSIDGNFGMHEDRHVNDRPYGPETPPTMPKGTVRVDVSDVYDWYKLGMHISDLKGLGKHDFGKGPPSTILSFGDEDLEHEYIQALLKTGLTTTDIDPVDPKQPKGMKRQKTDPTYNVGENFADGKNPGRKGLAKRSGVNCKQSVTKLRKVAKNSSGEKRRMAHWCANMKSGRD